MLCVPEHTLLSSWTLPDCMLHASLLKHDLQKHDIALSGANFGYLSEYTFLSFDMGCSNTMAELNHSVFVPMS